MEYKKFCGYFDSEMLGEKVAILKYEALKSEAHIPYCDCSFCKKPIKRVMYVVQSEETNVELLYLGADCINKLK